MDGGGFEPPKQFAADLQSVPFGHSGICPYGIIKVHKADEGTRTPNLLITNQLLCQLSHIGKLLYIDNTPKYFSVILRKYLPQRENGAYRARTCDPLLVRQMLSQLS